jgi:hypothetical protein
MRLNQFHCPLDGTKLPYVDPPGEYGHCQRCTSSWRVDRDEEGLLPSLVITQTGYEVDEFELARLDAEMTPDKETNYD